MEQRLSLITLGVADVARARRFYEALGWTASAIDGEGTVAFFQLPGMVLGLFGRDSLAADAGVPTDGSCFSGVALAYNTRSRDEVDERLKEAEAAGGRIVKPAEEAFWGGYTGYFADPDGHLWEVAWNADFAIGDDGAMTLPR